MDWTVGSLSLVSLEEFVSYSYLNVRTSFVIIQYFIHYTATYTGEVNNLTVLYLLQ